MTRDDTSEPGGDEAEQPKRLTPGQVRETLDGGGAVIGDGVISAAEDAALRQLGESSDAVEPDTRSKDRFINLVREWQGGCLLCGETELVDSLPGCEVDLGFPLCKRHLRWALASRRERMGRQSRRLKHLLLAWCRVHRKDRSVALRWLGY